MKNIISLDLKRNRIRIHKETLKLLDNPHYIYFLVNPSLGTFAVSPSPYFTKDALKLTNREDDYCEVYCKSFIHKLVQLNPNLNYGVTYRIQGESNFNDSLIVFDIHKTTMVDKKFSKKGDLQNE